MIQTSVASSSPSIFAHPKNLPVHVNFISFGLSGSLFEQSFGPSQFSMESGSIVNPKYCCVIVPFLS